MSRRRHPSPRTRALFLAAVLATLVAACGGSTPSPAAATPTLAAATSAASTAASPGATVMPTAAAGAGSAACNSSDVPSALRAALAAQDAASSYRVEGTVDAGGVKSAVLLEIQKPDRVHAVFGPLEVIGIGQTAWRKSGGSWVEQPGLDVLSLVAGKGQLDAEIPEKGVFTSVSVDTNSSVGTQPAVLYRYHESIAGELEADSQLWLEPASCRPIRNIATSTASSQQSSIDWTYSGWDAVSIEQPA